MDYEKWTEESEQAFQAMYGSLYARDSIGDFVPKRWASIFTDYVRRPAMEETKEAIEDIVKRTVDRALEQRTHLNPYFAPDPAAFVRFCDIEWYNNRIAYLERRILELEQRKWWQLW